MILDHLAHASLYAFPNPLLQRGLAALQDKTLSQRPPGRYELDGDRLFAIVQEYPTKPESACFWEAHRKYIDIQFVATGVERMAYAPLDSLKVGTPYDPAKDVVKLLLLPGMHTIELEVAADQFAIFFPHDAHMPCLMAGNSAPVRKIVVKVAVA